MRPVAKGSCPKDSQGNAIVFKEYAEARGELIRRLGGFCSYCERKIDASLAVEHIQPKASYPSLELEWDNFLLGCGNCNPTKGGGVISLDEYYWPDTDNPFYYLEYAPGGVIRPQAGLTVAETQRAQNTLSLTGLNSRPMQPSQRDKQNDRRWWQRKEAWDTAMQEKSNLAKHSEPDFRQDLLKTIVKLAKAYGFWSVWMTVFRDQPDFLELFLNAIEGTAVDCFEPAPSYAAKKRQSK